MVRDFDRSSGDRVVQQINKVTGLPLWVVEVIDADEPARQRTVKVKVAATVQPVLPSPAPGSPFTAVEFEGLMATPYVDSSRCQGNGKGKDKCGARLAYSLKATGVRAPSRGLSVRRPNRGRTRPDGAAEPGGAPLPAGRRPVSGGVRAVPGRAPMLVIGTGSALISFTLPEQLAAGHVDFARQLAAQAWAYAVAVERRYRGLPPLPDVPVPYRLTRDAEALLDAGPEQADLVPLPGGQELTA